MQSTLTLSVSNLLIERAERLLCKDLSFEIHAGEIVHIVGENGAGKSSLLKVIAGVLSPLEGELFFAGERITAHRDVLQAQLCYLGHLAGVKSSFTVIENLALHFPAATEVQILAALRSVNIEKYATTPAYQLSAGQQKRIGLARLWLTNKKVWLLDEPFTALDTKGVTVLEEKLQQHAELGGMTLLTTHQKLNSTLHARELSLDS
ncbi:cytochrome c biogenesis heme-transporting ATPase CcmA [Marinomonas agarivorans]|nr:cytochrome c biogenesis heme-transporting ATPase CcmA [Marinomonas agarivorans]